MATAIPNANINIPYSAFLDENTGRPSQAWLQWLMNPSVISINSGSALSVTSGGTGFSFYAVGDLLYANTTTTLAKLPDVATGNALISGGVNTAPLWGKIGLTTHVSGILPVANGGTISAPVTKTADFSIAATDLWLINNKSGSTCTVTLPAASAYSGRLLHFQNYQVQALVSASSDVVPIAGGAAGTSILVASSGDQATLVSDGTNWLMTQYIPNNILLLET
jgi:hypothetical protein